MALSWADDPEIRRVAGEAETRLIQDPDSGYIAWPTPPPKHPPRTVPNGHAPPQLDGGQGPVDSGPSHVEFSPVDEYDPALDPELVQPQQRDPASTTTAAQQYSSPYDQQDPATPAWAQPVTETSAPAPTDPVANPTTNNNVAPPQQSEFPQNPQYANNSHGPPIQPAPPQRVTLSRSRETKILLSIDGDGVRGLSALLIIESLVNAVCVKIGQRFDTHQIFDLTGGSSLGGVIAILLCRLRMQAHRAREAYKQISRHVFMSKRDFFISLDPNAPTPNIDANLLEHEIKNVISQEIGNVDELLLDPREDSGDV